LHYGKKKDLIYLTNLNQNETLVITEFPADQRKLGAGLFLGFSYFIAENLSLYTEAGFNYLNSKYLVNELTGAGLIYVNGQLVPSGLIVTGGRFTQDSKISLNPF